MKTLSFTFLILVCSISLSAQNKITGTWVLEKIEINDREQPEIFHIDTLNFLEDSYRQAILREEKDNKFMWIQSGKYELKKKKLRLYDRLSSTGESGKFYSELVYTWTLKNNQLTLSSAQEMDVPQMEKSKATINRIYRKIR